VYALEAATGSLDEAKTGLEKLVKQWPDFVEAHVQLARIYSQLHQNQDSERERRIIIELNGKARAKGPQPEASGLSR
jgi:Tfp pilus assembly protein PilF